MSDFFVALQKNNWLEVRTCVACAYLLVVAKVHNFYFTLYCVGIYEYGKKSPIRVKFGVS
jgi:hypothetical protein